MAQPGKQPLFFKAIRGIIIIEYHINTTASWCSPNIGKKTGLSVVVVIVMCYLCVTYMNVVTALSYAYCSLDRQSLSLRLWGWLCTTRKGLMWRYLHAGLTSNTFNLYSWSKTAEPKLQLQWKAHSNSVLNNLPGWLTWEINFGVTVNNLVVRLEYMLSDVSVFDTDGCLLVERKMPFCS